MPPPALVVVLLNVAVVRGTVDDVLNVSDVLDADVVEELEVELVLEAVLEELELVEVALVEDVVVVVVVVVGELVSVEAEVVAVVLDSGGRGIKAL